MRILLAQNSQYYPAHGGGNKSNRLMLEALAAKGHECRVVTRVSEALDAEQQTRYLDELSQRGIRSVLRDGVLLFHLNGVEVHTETNLARLRDYFVQQIVDFRPTWTIVSTDDPAQILLAAALEASGGRVVYLVRTTLALPFGPDAAFHSEPKTAMMRRAAAVVGVSYYVRDYIRKWGGISAEHVPISLQDQGPFPDFSCFDRGSITMVNPCAIKGVSIFVDLAKHFPHLPFAAIPTWGTTDADRRTLLQVPNITLHPPRDDIDDILSGTRIMLVPSLWAEARSRIVVESMLRGVPVIASRVGGLPEAMMGMDYSLPVNPIVKYEHRLDEQMVPVADVPPQDMVPWMDALRRLTEDRKHYESLSRASRDKAMNYVEGLTIDEFESLLHRLAPQSASKPVTVETAPSGESIATLTPEKRRLLALLLEKRRARTSAPSPVHAVAQTRNVWPVSFAQERMLHTHRRGGETVYNVLLGTRILGALNVEALERSLNLVASRHDALRTTFGERDGRLVQVVADQPSIKLRRFTGDAVTIAHDEVSKPFDVAAHPPWRAALVKASDQDHALLLTVHHVLADGWSFGVFARELSAAYAAALNGDAAHFTALDKQYGQFAEWQREQVAAGAMGHGIAWWKRTLSGTTALPWQATGSFEGSRLRSVLEARHATALTDNARRAGCTLFTLLLAVLYGCLVKWTALRDLTVGTAVANRSVPGFESAIGMFVNTVALRARIDRGDGIREILETTRSVVGDALAHQAVPFESLGEPVPPVLFVLQNASEHGLTLAGCRTDPLHIDPGTSEHPIRISVAVSPDGLTTLLQYQASALSAETAQGMLDDWDAALKTAAMPLYW